MNIKRKYAAQNILIRTGWRKEKVDEVKIELPDNVWMDLFDLEGENLGSCCATISAVRQIIMEAAHNSRYMKAESLYKLVMYVKGHSHDDEKNDSVFQYFFDLWDKIKEDVEIEQFGLPTDPNDPWDCLNVIWRSSSLMSIERMFRQSSDPESEFRYSATMGLEFLKVYPALKTLFEKIKDLDIPAVEGFAVCSGDELIESSGLEVFLNSKIAEQIAKDCNQAEERDFEKNPPKRPKRHFTTRPVRISMDKGLEFLDKT